MLWIYVFGIVLTTVAAFNSPRVPVDFNLPDEILSTISDDVANNFAEEYLRFLRSGYESPTLRRLSAQLAKAHSKKDIFTKEYTELSTPDQFVLCTTCRATVRVAASMVREEDGELNGPEAESNAKAITLDVCRRLNLQTEEVCEGLFNSNWPSIEYIVKETVIDSRTFCSLFMEYSFCNVKNPEYNWTLNIAAGNPITGPKSDIPKNGDDDLRILHLTDVHYDPLYVAGSLAECDEPLCCQRHKDAYEGTSKAAGYWGDYRDCDAPWHLIENALEHIKRTHSQIDYIYQTGDVVDHMVWGTSEEKNIGVLSTLDDALVSTFPGVQVFPCIGNHEPHPLNVFSPDNAPAEINTHWLYEHLYSSWSRWLPASTKDTILKGGYYTVSPRTGFRIVALNNNDCYNMNWWLFYSGTDKQPQLQWLHDTLLEAERNKEKVHILAHIPSGDGSCWSVWSREYNKIIERFSHTKSGIFNGHSHKDELNVHYSANGYAVGISWNGGALTTFSDKNPNYRLYQVETATMQVVDHETWIFNLTEANENGKNVEPKWFKEYTFASEFTTDTSPNGIDKLLDRFAEQPDLLRKFWRFKMTNADPRIDEGCGKACLLGTICRTATTVNDQRSRCNELMKKLELALDDETSTTSATSSTTPSSSSTGSSSIGTTGPPTSGTTEGSTPDPGDDGAASLIAMSFSSIMAIFFVAKYII